MYHLVRVLSFARRATTPACMVIVLLFLSTHAAIGQAPDILNYYSVDPHLSRSAQPTSAQFASLEKFGFCRVLNLRNARSDKRRLRSSQLEYVHLRVNTWRMSYQDVVQALVAIQRSECPVLVHCHHGADRTGVVVAAYRIAYQGWTSAAAIEEFTGPQFGFHARWFSNLVRLVESLEPEVLRRDVELAMSLR